MREYKHMFPPVLTKPLVMSFHRHLIKQHAAIVEEEKKDTEAAVTASKKRRRAPQGTEEPDAPSDAASRVQPAAPGRPGVASSVYVRGMAANPEFDRHREKELQKTAERQEFQRTRGQYDSLVTDALNRLDATPTTHFVYVTVSDLHTVFSANPRLIRSKILHDVTLSLAHLPPSGRKSFTSDYPPPPKLQLVSLPPPAAPLPRVPQPPPSPSGPPAAHLGAYARYNAFQKPQGGQGYGYK
jgi:hypothetical protein